MAKFILVEHDAIRRKKHWDLRFEIPDSKNWASFSMNEFPPLEPNKRLYIPRSNDHSREAALYIGKIPEGEYGAGILKKIDEGKCDVIKYKNAHIVVNFKGKKLKGLYHFINVGVFGKRKQYNKKVYTFFKGKDQKILKELFNMKIAEKSQVLKERKKKFIFLYHGTRAKDEIIKREGLKLSNQIKYGYDEEQKYGNYISFTSNKKYAKTFTSGLFSKTSVFLVKLDTRFLKFGYNTEGNFDEYIYLKDVPKENIIFPNDELYSKIEKLNDYLES